MEVTTPQSVFYDYTLVKLLDGFPTDTTMQSKYRGQIYNLSERKDNNTNTIILDNKMPCYHINHQLPTSSTINLLLIIIDNILWKNHMYTTAEYYLQNTRKTTGGL